MHVVDAPGCVQRGWVRRCPQVLLGQFSARGAAFAPAFRIVCHFWGYNSLRLNHGSPTLANTSYLEPWEPKFDDGSTSKPHESKFNDKSTSATYRNPRLTTVLHFRSMVPDVGIQRCPKTRCRRIGNFGAWIAGAGRPAGSPAEDLQNPSCCRLRTGHKELTTRMGCRSVGLSVGRSAGWAVRRSGGRSGGWSVGRSAGLSDGRSDERCGAEPSILKPNVVLDY